MRKAFQFRPPNRHVFQVKLVYADANVSSEAWTDINIDSKIRQPDAALIEYLHKLFDPSAIKEKNGIFHVTDQMLPDVVVERYYQLPK